MNQLFSIGKKVFKSKHEDNDDDDEHNGSSSDKFGNPIAMLKTFDRDGDGKITENGKQNYINNYY